MNLDKDLYQACERNTPEEVREFLRKGADPNGYCDDNGWFPLHKSAFRDNKDLAEALVKHGARADVVTHRGNLPLHFAARFGRTNVLPFLLSVITDKNKQNEDGDTALHKAVANGETEAVKLLAPLTDLTIKNKKDETIADLAFKQKNQDIRDVFVDVIINLAEKGEAINKVYYPFINEKILHCIRDGKNFISILPSWFGEN